MIEVVAIVEGETEQAFVRDQLAPHLGARNTVIWAVLPGRTRRQGGVKPWPITKNDIVRALKEGRHCTTMFDFYAMPESWPQRAASKSLPWERRAACIEAAMLEDIAAAMGSGFDEARFIPYVQLHEFEALLFADIDALASVAAANMPPAGLKESLTKILDEAGHPEAIDDGYDTCPSRRIARLVPGYRKRLHGPIVANRIGLDILSARCHHFGGWLERLESLGS